MADSESVRYPAIPNWAKTTPPGPAEDKHPYSLVMFDEEGNGIEEIDLTRSEYLDLKSRLAARRNYYGSLDQAHQVLGDMEVNIG